MQVQPYLFFDGRCEEALGFYQRALGAEILQIMRMKDSPAPRDPQMSPPGTDDKVLHASFRVGDSIVFASDGHCAGTPVFKGFALSLTVGTGEEAERSFTALSDGGQVQMPLGKTFFSSHFGMVTDRFGVLWMVYVTP